MAGGLLRSLHRQVGEQHSEGESLVSPRPVTARTARIRISGVRRRRLRTTSAASSAMKPCRTNPYTPPEQTVTPLLMPTSSVL